jgi:hypothetical protein
MNLTTNEANVCRWRNGRGSILQHVGPFLSNDCKQRPLLGNRFLIRANRLAGKRCFLRGPGRCLRTQQRIQQQEVFSVRSVPRSYKQDN